MIVNVENIQIKLAAKKLNKEFNRLGKQANSYMDNAEMAIKDGHVAEAEYWEKRVLECIEKRSKVLSELLEMV